MPLRQGESVPQMVARIAREQGLDARATKIALAIVAQESKFNPGAEGDWSAKLGRMRSIGLFQLNEEGLGAGMGEARYDPEANALKGIQNLKANYAKNPNLSDGEIAYNSQRPADKAGYTATINAKTSGRDAQWSPTIAAAMGGGGLGGDEALQPTARQQSAGGPTFPVAGQTLATTRVTTEHGARGSNAGYAGVPETHRGIDLSAKRGAQVLAPRPGTVTIAHNWDGSKNDPYGNWIEVKGDDGTSYRFAHLQEMNVKAGDQVGGGQTIGAVDSTGNSTGDHLHFEEIQNGQPINPRDDLAGTSSGAGGTRVADNSQALALVTALEQQKQAAQQRANAARAEVEARENKKIFNQQQIDAINAKPANARTAAEKAQIARAGATSLVEKNATLDAEIPQFQERFDTQDKTLREIDVQLATARKLAAGEQLDPSQKKENEAQAAQANANAAKLEQEVADAKDKGSPENQQKLAQADLWRKQAANYDSITAADNNLKGAQAVQAGASANASNAQAEFSRGTLESTIRTHLAAAGLNDAQAKVALAQMQPTIDKIIAETGKTKDDAAYTRALTKAVQDKLPAEIENLKSTGKLTDQQAIDLAAKLPYDLVLKGTQARLDQAQAESARSTGILNIATAKKTEWEVQKDAWKTQRQAALSKLMADPNVTSDQLSGFLMASASDATEMINAFNAQVAKSAGEETARHQKTQEGIEIQNADETMRNNLAGNITNYMNARTNQQNASTSAMGPMLGSVRDFNALSAMSTMTGTGDESVEGLRSIAANMGVGDSVLNGVLNGLKEYQGTIKGFKDQMPNVRMANANVATPNFITPGVTQGVKSGSAAAAAAAASGPPPPSAPTFNIPNSVPADAPAAVQAKAGDTSGGLSGDTSLGQAGNTPPDQMDDTSNGLPQQLTEEEVQKQKEAEGGGGGGGRGGGGAFAFTPPKGHGKKSGKPSRAARAMGAFTAPGTGRAA